MAQHPNRSHRLATPTDAAIPHRPTLPTPLPTTDTAKIVSMALEYSRSRAPGKRTGILVMEKTTGISHDTNDENIASTDAVADTWLRSPNG